MSASTPSDNMFAVRLGFWPSTVIRWSWLAASSTSAMGAPNAPLSWSSANTRQAATSNRSVVVRIRSRRITL